MNIRFRLNDHALTRMKTLGMPIALLEELVRCAQPRRLTACWELALDGDGPQAARFGRFAAARLLLSDDGRVLDIQTGAAVGSVPRPATH